MSRFVKPEDVTDDDIISGETVENVELPPDEANEKLVRFVTQVWPWIKDSAEARGLPPYLVALALRSMADAYDAMSMKEES